MIHREPAPGRKFNRRTKIVLIVVGSVLALCCIGDSIGGNLLHSTINNAIAPPQAEATVFLYDLEAERYSSAYNCLCASARAQFTLEQFTEGARAQRPTTHRLAGTNVSNINGRVSATVTARITYANGFTDDHVLRLVKENGAWRVCGNPY